VGVRAGTGGFVLAVDAGGTYTRAGCYGLDGALLGAGSSGGGSAQHNHDARANVDAAVIAALQAAGLQASDALALCAGLSGWHRAGSNQGSTNEWANGFFSVPGLDCTRLLVNDAVIAHRGALAGQAGIIVVGGTGSMILAINERDEEIESGQFEHYAGGARHLVYDVVHQVLTSSPPASTTDPIVEAVLSHWSVHSVSELRRAVLQRGTTDRNDVKRRYGAFAPLVTAAVDTSPMAEAAVRGLASKTARGVQLLAPVVEADPVPLACAGALATSPAFRDRLAEELSTGSIATRMVEAVLDPMAGAALIALKSLDIDLSADLLTRLRSN
jgi:glucosamine kinase